MPIVPSRCILCESEWQGGHEVPGKPMKESLRIFYKCGASLSYKILSNGTYNFLTKNCENHKERYEYEERILW